jgi:hypothetical protein
MSKVEPKASPLDEFKEFIQISIANLDSPDLAETRVDERLKVKLQGLMNQRKGIKFDVFDVPTLHEDTRTEIAKNGYCHKIFGDLNILIPPEAK